MRPEGADNYLRWRRSIDEHLELRRLSWDEYGMFSWLCTKANPRTGTLRTSWPTLGDQTGLSANYVGKLCGALKRKGYIAYANHRGRHGRLVEVAIDKFPLPDGTYTALGEGAGRTASELLAELPADVPAEVLAEVPADVPAELEGEASTKSSTSPFGRSRSRKRSRERISSLRVRCAHGDTDPEGALLEEAGAPDEELKAETSPGAASQGAAERWGDEGRDSASEMSPGGSERAAGRCGGGRGDSTEELSSFAEPARAASSLAAKGSGAELLRECDASSADGRLTRECAGVGANQRPTRELAIASTVQHLSRAPAGAAQRVPREPAAARADQPFPRELAIAGGDDRLSRDEALAAAPRALRETLELFWLKTGRADLAADELRALRGLDHLHTPAVIQQTITRAVERFGRRGADPATLSLTYVHDSLRRFTTLRHDAPTGRLPAVPMAAAYPPGLTRLS